MSNVISVLSGKGGVGKSIISLNLATALASLNSRVLLIDFNLTSPSLNLMLGEINPEFHLNYYLRGLILEKDIVYAHPSGLKLIFNSGEEIPHKDLISKFDSLIDSLSNYFDYIFIDTSPSLSEDTQKAIFCSQFAIGVSEPTISSLTHTFRVLKFAEEKNTDIVGIILNKVGLLNTEISIKAIENITNYKVLGEIAFNNKIQKSELVKHPLVYLYRNHKLSQNFFKIAQFLMGSKYEEMLDKHAKKSLDEVYSKLGLDPKKHE